MSLTKVSYSMVQGAVVNVLDFMTPVEIASVLAKDYSSELHVAIQAAFDYAFANNKAVYFPGGGYLVNTQVISSPVGPEMRIFGDGHVNTIIKSTNTAIGGIFAFQGPHPEVDGAGNRIGPVTVEDMGFVGTGSGVGTAIGLLIYGVQGIRLSNVSSTQFKTGIQFHNTDLVHIENSYVSYCDTGITTLGTGYAPGNDANSFNVTDSYVTHCTTVGIAHNGGEALLVQGNNFVLNGISVTVASTSYSSVTTNAVIDSNYFESDTVYCLLIGGGGGIVRGGRITNNAMLVTAGTTAIICGNVSNVFGKGLINWNTMSVSSSQRFCCQSTSTYINKLNVGIIKTQRQSVFDVWFHISFFDVGVIYYNW